MNLKQFLKPEWRKILICIILSSIGLYNFYSTEINMFLYHILTFPAMLFLMIGVSSAEAGYLELTFLTLILGFICSIFYLYFLACLIVWICDKFIISTKIRLWMKKTRLIRDFNDFLKPDYRKIIIFLVFFIIGTFIIFMAEALIHCIQFYSEIFNDRGPSILTPPSYTFFREDPIIGIFTKMVNCESIFDTFDSPMLMPLYSVYILLPLCSPYVISIFLSKTMFLSPYILCIIYWYILSCLIVWIYDKYKKK